jgi:hypothetical protein
MAGKTLFIVNPVSGKLSIRKRFTNLTEQLSANPSYDLVHTEYRGHAHELNWL